MKCPCCNGTGRTPMVTIVKTDSGLPCDFPCIECDGTGEVEMTNEYFLQTATTEQLAEWIVSEINERVKLALHDSELNDGDVDADFYMEDSDDWVEWLKQPHKGD